MNMARVKNLIILIILFSFLCLVAIMPVTCIFKTVTGISCPACGMTRSFLAILHFNFLEACFQNLLGIPLFIFLAFSVVRIFYDLYKNIFSYIPNLLDFLGKHYILFLLLILVSFVFNNLK